MNDSFLASQVIAAIAFVCGVISYQFRDRRIVIYCWASCSLIYSMHFLLLNQFTPAITAAITGARFILAQRSSSKMLCAFFIFATLLAGYCTYKVPVNIFPTIAGVIGTLSVFFLPNAQMRIGLGSCSLLWICHNYIVGSPVGVIMEFIFLISNAIGYYRLRMRWEAISAGKSPPD